MKKIKVMIVEDEAIVALSIRFFLEKYGYEVTSIVASGEESIQHAGTEKPDIVLMDIQLRDTMDGVEAASIIDSRFNIPVVFLSAYTMDILDNRSHRVKSFPYLTKPFKDKELKEVIEDTLRKKSACDA